MRNKLYDEIENKRFFDFISKKDKTLKKEITKFLKWCFDNNMMEYISDSNIDFCYQYDCISLPLLKRNHICIGINIPDTGDSAIIGIDPSECFDKVSKCSIIAKLPITSKREEEHFYKFLTNLFDKTNKSTRNWFKEASACFCGSYALFE